MLYIVSFSVCFHLSVYFCLSTSTWVSTLSIGESPIYQLSFISFRLFCLVVVVVLNGGGVFGMALLFSILRCFFNFPHYDHFRCSFSNCCVSDWCIKFFDRKHSWYWHCVYMMWIEPKSHECFKMQWSERMGEWICLPFSLSSMKKARKWVNRTKERT